MIFATTTRLNRYVCATVPLLALLALSAGCGDEGAGTGSGGAGGAGATGGSGGGGTGGTGGTGGSGATGGASGSSGAGGGAGTDAGGTGLYGTFLISILDEPPPPYTKFAGQVLDGFKTQQPVLKLDSQEGACQLFVPKNPFCMGGCTAGGVCIDENNCEPARGTVDVGIAHVTGFKGGEITISPTKPANSYQPSPTLPARACDEGGALEVRTDKFTLQGKCVAPLELMTQPMEKVLVKTGTPVKVVWTAPGQAGISRVVIHLDIAHHGGKKGEINCDVPDTGSFEMPLMLTNKLVSLGLAGFPTIDVKRIHTSVAPNEPNVKIEVTSDVSRDVDTGVVSCMDSTMCPPGQMCDRDLTCK
jgi:hypothetical protein